MAGEIEYLTLVSTTSMTQCPAVPSMWVHHDLKGREFSDVRQTLSAEELAEVTDMVDWQDSQPEVDTDDDPDADGYGWERRALGRAA